MENFKLTNIQDQAVDLAIDPMLKQLMLYGGSRSGKTFLATYMIFVRAAKTKSRHCILRFKFAHAIQSIWLDTIPKMLNIAMPDLNAIPNKSRYYYTLPNGSEVWVGGLDNADRAEKILGNEYSTMYFNECSQLDYSSISLARTRLAEKNNLRKITIYDQNPPKKSHWSYWLFEKGIDPVEDEPIDSPEEFASILMNPKDNIENIDEDYLKTLSKLPEKERKRFLLGEYDDESDGNAYHAFIRDVHVVDKVDKLPGSIFIGMDFNVDPMTAIICQIADGTLRVIDEVFDRNSDTPKMCSILKKRGYSGLQVIPDSTGKNRKTSGQTDFQILKDAGFTVMSTYNPLQIDRVNSTRDINSTESNDNQKNDLMENIKINNFMRQQKNRLQERRAKFVSGEKTIRPRTGAKIVLPTTPVLRVWQYEPWGRLLLAG